MYNCDVIGSEFLEIIHSKKSTPFACVFHIKILPFLFFYFSFQLIIMNSFFSVALKLHWPHVAYQSAEYDIRSNPGTWLKLSETLYTVQMTTYMYITYMKNIAFYTK